MPDLIIVESPGKIKTIQKYVGKKYVVKASIGHVKDLPKKELGVDVKNNFEPSFEVTEDKKEVVSDLKKAAKAAGRVFLATDPDREGESIAAHLADELNVTGLCRITFNEITQSAIEAALKNPREINTHKADAATARRVLDRLMGYSLSPLLWRKVAPKTSAGRVQSAALLLIAQKEREIRRFLCKDYWTIEAELQVDKDKIKTNLVDDDGKQVQFTSEKEAIEALETINKSKITFLGMETKASTRAPYAPFTTSTLQQAGAAALGLSAHQTMQRAQKLYEGMSVEGHGETALITYMRTDSTRSAPEAITAARDAISAKFTKNYLPGTARSYEGKKTKNTQGAHEAVRPAHIEIDPDCLKNSDYGELYALIWKRFIASQMSDAKLEQKRLTFGAGKLKLEARGSRILFDGFLAVYPIGIEEQTLPDIKQPKNMSLDKADANKHTTMPPKRFSEANLVKTLEKEGIGRPSTYASTIKTIVDRGYVTKDKTSFHLTELGLLINDALQAHFNKIVSLKFTSEMEENLDKIEEGGIWTEVVKEFYEAMDSSLKLARKNLKMVLRTSVKCEACENHFGIKYGINGRFLACEGYPKCKQTRDLPDSFNILDFIDTYSQKDMEVSCEAVQGLPCPKCEKVLKRKNSRFGAFWGCSGYPECKYTKNISTPVIKCPVCENGNIVEKGKTAKKFYACDGYPDCKKLFSHKPTEDKCESCSEHLVLFKKGKICINKPCDKYVSTFPKGKFQKKEESDG